MGECHQQPQHGQHLIRYEDEKGQGRQVVFARKLGQDSELALVAVSGGTATTVLRSTTTQQNFRTPVFSPDGQRIAFASPISPATYPSCMKHSPLPSSFSPPTRN